MPHSQQGKVGRHDFRVGWKQFYFELEKSCTIKEWEPETTQEHKG